MITIIVAMDKNRGIGKDGKLLTYLPGDLPRFKKLTMNKSIIMGRKTFESLPNGPLPNRKNIVITRNREYKADGAEIEHSVFEAIRLCDPFEEVFIIGGGEIYKETLKLADKLYITEIDKEFDADTWFPELGDMWKLSESTPVTDDPDLTYSYNTYIRKD